MKNLIFIESVLSLLKANGVTLNDLNAYANNQSVPQVSSSACKLPLEVLYDGDYRSFFFEVDKTPVAIICGNIGVAFEDAPKKMNWHDANRYCKTYSVGGKNWQLPNKEAGHLNILYKNKEAINVILKAFGREPLKESWYWASKYGTNLAWNIRFSDGYVGWYGKNGNYNYVRPVLIF